MGICLKSENMKSELRSVFLTGTNALNAFSERELLLQIFAVVSLRIHPEQMRGIDAPLSTAMI